jgi:hypothetical protein
MQQFKFDMRSLNDLYNKHKATQDQSKTDTAEQQIKIILKAAESLDLSACQRAYEKHFVETGNMKPYLIPSVCYTKELNIPYDGYSLPVLESELKKRFKGFELCSWDMYADGPRITVKPEHFSFDMVRLYAERANVLAKQKQIETDTINKAIPILISEVLAIDLEKCFEGYNLYFTQYGNFPLAGVAEARTKEVQLVTPVAPVDLRDQFHKVFSSFHLTDNRKVEISSWSYNGAQFASAYVLKETFQ